jgi:hypothetical protein
MKKATILILTMIGVISLLAMSSVNVVAQVDSIAEYHFDENSSNNDGTIHGATWTTGISGSALNFDGINDNVLIPNSDNLNLENDMALEAWIYINNYEPESYNGIIAKYNVNGGYLLTVDNFENNITRIKFFLRTNSTYHRFVTSDNSLLLNKWYHIVGVLDNNIMNLYVNGVKQAEQVEFTKPFYSNEDVKIGIYNHSNWGFDGIIDEVSIYDEALTESEILAHYHQFQSTDDNDDNQTSGQTDSIDWTKVIIYLGVPAIICITVVSVVYLIAKKPKIPLPPK